MIAGKSGEVIITNDGATILQQMEVAHPTAKMLVDLAKAQDTEAGDGTTSVTVLCGAFLDAAQKLLEKGIHPTIISEAFVVAEQQAVKFIEAISSPVDLTDREQLIKVASTSLNSKVVSQNAQVLAPVAVDAMLRIIDPTTATNVDLRDVAIVKKIGGTIDDTELVDGLVFTQKAVKAAGGPTRVPNAKIGLIQFCLSPPKTDIDQSVIVSDYAQMDRILKEERKYILDLCKKIQKTGCNVLFIQKSILRDAVTDLSLHFLAKMKILVVNDIERDDIEFICKTVGCTPAASIETFTAEKLGKADLVAEEATPDSKIVRVSGVPNPGKTVTIFVRASNKMTLDEVRARSRPRPSPRRFAHYAPRANCRHTARAQADRSIHDALCVLRCLVKKRYLTPGGGAPEAEASFRLAHWSNELPGMQAYCVKAFATALDVRARARARACACTRTSHAVANALTLKACMPGSRLSARTGARARAHARPWRPVGASARSRPAAPRAHALGARSAPPRRAGHPVHALGERGAERHQHGDRAAQPACGRRGVGGDQRAQGGDRRHPRGERAGTTAGVHLGHLARHRVRAHDPQDRRHGDDALSASSCNVVRLAPRPRGLDRGLAPGSRCQVECRGWSRRPARSARAGHGTKLRVRHGPTASALAMWACFVRSWREHHLQPNSATRN